MIGARDDITKEAHHLAAIADSEGEGIRPFEEGGKHGAQVVVVEDGVGPSCTCAEDISIAEATAGCEAGKVGQVGASCEQIRHGHIYRLAAGGVEGCCHLNLPIDALFSQNRDSGSRCREHTGGAEVIGDVEIQPRVLAVGDSIERLLRTCRIIAPNLNLIREL